MKRQASLHLKLVVSAAAALATWNLSAQTLDLSSFGARCDGSTDDTPALNAAIKAASLQALVLNVSSGVCVHRQITISVPVSVRIVKGAVLKLMNGANG